MLELKKVQILQGYEKYFFPSLIATIYVILFVNVTFSTNMSTYFYEY